MIRKAISKIKKIRVELYENNLMLKGIYSYLQNEYLMRVIGFDEQTNNPNCIDYFSYIHSLLNIKEPVGDIKFERVGRDYDGGYVMFESALCGGIAYSIGICDDVSWDKDMAQRGYDIFQYDHTIDKLPEQNSRFHWKKIGLTGICENKNLRYLSTLINENGHADASGMVLKIDIEGSEWDAFKNIDTSLLNKFDQIVIEMHELLNQDYWGKIEVALQNLSVNHQVIHIHPNNWGRVAYINNLIIPDSIEVTYLNKNNYTFKEYDKLLPSTLDMPCNPNMPEIILGKW